MFADDPGPDNKSYQHVNDTWPELETSTIAPFKKLVSRSPFFQDLKAAAVDYYIKILTVKNRNDVLTTDDHSQLAETSSMLLGGTPSGGISWKKPGAVHKARFMANVMFAFQDILEYDAETVSTLRRFVIFNVLIYVPHFLSAGVGADAAFDDLKL